MHTQTRETAVNSVIVANVTEAVVSAIMNVSGGDLSTLINDSVLSREALSMMVADNFTNQIRSCN